MRNSHSSSSQWDFGTPSSRVPRTATKPAPSAKQTRVVVRSSPLRKRLLRETTDSGGGPTLRPDPLWPRSRPAPKIRRRDAGQPLDGDRGVAPDPQGSPARRPSLRSVPLSPPLSSDTTSPAMNASHGSTPAPVEAATVAARLPGGPAEIVARKKLGRIAAFNAIRRAFSGRSRATRFHVLGRFLTCPYLRTLRHVEAGSHVLDVGAGHGILAVLAVESGAASITTIEPDLRKTLTTFQHPRVRVVAGLIDAIAGHYDLVTLYDVLYRIPIDDRDRLLEAIHGRLRPGGLLLVKEMDPDQRLKSAWNRGAGVGVRPLPRPDHGQRLLLRVAQPGAGASRALRLRASARWKTSAASTRTRTSPTRRMRRPRRQQQQSRGRGSHHALYSTPSTLGCAARASRRRTRAARRRTNAALSIAIVPGSPMPTVA